MQRPCVQLSVERGGGGGRGERWGLDRKAGNGRRGEGRGKREILPHKDLKEEGIEKVTSEGAEFGSDRLARKAAQRRGQLC